MTHLGDVVARCELPAPVEPTTPVESNEVTAPGAPRPGRRDLLLTEAVRLFDDRGYQAVTMADIGEAAGIVASGVYRHFPSKTAILVAAANRGGERLRGGVDRVVAEARTPKAAVAGLVRWHVDMTLEQQHLMGVLANESDQLPDDERRALRRFQADYLDTWVQALEGVLPEERNATELKIVVHAVQSMIYFVVRRAGDGAEANLGDRLEDLGLALMLGC